MAVLREVWGSPLGSSGAVRLYPWGWGQSDDRQGQDGASCPTRGTSPSRGSQASTTPLLQPAGALAGRWGEAKVVQRNGLSRGPANGEPRLGGGRMRGWTQSSDRSGTTRAPLGSFASRAAGRGVWHQVMVTAVASGALLAVGSGARQGGGVSKGSGLEGMRKDHPAPQQEPLPPGHGAQSSCGTPSSCGSTTGSLARSWGAEGSRHSPPIAKPKGGLCPDPPGCRSPSPCPACGAAGEPKVVGRAPCPAAAGLRRTAPANGESRLLLPAGHRARGPHRTPLGSALTSRGCSCACVAPLALPSLVELGCPRQDPWRDQVADGARTLGFAQAEGHGQGCSAPQCREGPRSPRVAADGSVSWVPSARSPPRPPSKFPFWVLPLLELKLHHPDTATLPCGSHCPAPQGAPEPPLPPGAQPPSPSCRSRAPTGHHSPLQGD